MREKVLFQLFLLLCHPFPVVSTEDVAYYQTYYLKCFTSKKIISSVLKQHPFLQILMYRIGFISQGSAICNAAT